MMSVHRNKFITSFPACQKGFFLLGREVGRGVDAPIGKQVEKDSGGKDGLCGERSGEIFGSDNTSGGLCGLFRRSSQNPKEEEENSPLTAC
jgi:hypothetical protein